MKPVSKNGYAVRVRRPSEPSVVTVCLTITKYVMCFAKKTNNSFVLNRRNYCQADWWTQTIPRLGLLFL